MRLTLTGIKAWIGFLAIISLVILFLTFFFGFALLLIPLLFVLGIIGWFLSLFKRKKKKKSYIDAEFRIK